MFEDPKTGDAQEIEVFVQGVTLMAKDDKRIAKVSFYKTPVDYDLAHSLDPKIAGHLFRKDGNGWAPVTEMPNARFLTYVPPVNLSFAPHPDLRSAGGTIRNVKIGDIHALKVLKDKNDHTLAWSAEFEIEDNEITSLLVINHLKEKVYVQMSEVPEDQRKMEFPSPPEGGVCKVCGDSDDRTDEQKKATWISSAGNLYCDEHVGVAKDEEVLKIGVMS